MTDRQISGNKNKIMIYTSFPYWPRLETELELAEKHLNQGDEVLLISCMGDLAICPDNPKHRLLKCLSCKSRLYAGHKWLGENRVELKQLYNIYDKQRIEINEILSQNFKCWNDLRKIQIDGDDVGEAAFSELVSHLRETNPDLVKDDTFAKKLLENALIVHFSIKNHLLKEKPDKFILFNGRISSYRPALRLGTSFGIETEVFEVDFTFFNKYLLSKNTYSHNTLYISDKLVELYENSTCPEEEKREITSIFFYERENGNPTVQFSYTHKQRSQSDFKNIIERSNLNVGIFISSEDEILTIPECQNPFYKNQNTAISKIADDLVHENINLIVRAHPNLSGRNNSQMKDLIKVCSVRSKLHLIPPESKISTYELIEACDIILVFGSTVGIESVYKNKPTILMGVAQYRGFGGTIEPKSHDELITILKECAECGFVPTQYMPSKFAMDKAATIYAYGICELGIEQEYQKLTSFDKISWIEKDSTKTYIRPHLIFRITDSLYKISELPKKGIIKVHKFIHKVIRTI